MTLQWPTIDGGRSLVAVGMVTARVYGEIRVSHGRDEDDDVEVYGWSIW